MQDSGDVRETRAVKEMPKEATYSNIFSSISLFILCIACLILYYNKDSLSSYFHSVDENITATINRLAAVDDQILDDISESIPTEGPSPSPTPKSNTTAIIIIIVVIIIIIIVIILLICCIIRKKKAGNSQYVGIEESASTHNMKEYMVNGSIEEKIPKIPVINDSEDVINCENRSVNIKTEDANNITKETSNKTEDELNKELNPTSNDEEDGDSQDSNSRNPNRLKRTTIRSGIDQPDDQQDSNEKPKAEPKAFSPETVKLHTQESIEKMQIAERRKLRRFKVEIKQKVVND